jgi:hypothetical protein
MVGSKFPPADFEPNERFHQFERRQNPSADYQAELDRFRAYEFAAPKTDWNRAWLSWWLRAKPSAQTNQLTKVQNLVSAFADEP